MGKKVAFISTYTVKINHVSFSGVPDIKFKPAVDSIRLSIKKLA